MIGPTRSSLAQNAPMPTPAHKQPCHRCGRRAEHYHDGEPLCGPCLDAAECRHESRDVERREPVEPIAGVGGYACRGECHDCGAVLAWHELPGGGSVDMDVLGVA